MRASMFALLLFLSVALAFPAAGQTVGDSLTSVLGVDFGGSDSTLLGRKLRINAYPYAYYTPETELAVGAGGILTFYTGRDSLTRPSSLTLSAYYATTKQYSITLNPKLYFARNRYYAGANFNFKHAVDKFYGIGNDSPDLGTEEYVADRHGVELDIQVPPVISVSDRIGLFYEFQKSTIVDVQDNPYLVAPDLPGADGGSLSGMGLTWLWDSRDHTFYPRHGQWVRMRVTAYSRSLGSDFTYTTIELDDRVYLPLGKEVVALQFYAAGLSGTAPFHRLPALGGSQRMRGYFEGRYRDNVFLMTQAEYRKQLSGRFGVVAFAGLGDVAPELWAMELDEFKFSFGGGLRYLFNPAERVNLRVDFGIGRDTNGVYFGVEESF